MSSSTNVSKEQAMPDLPPMPTLPTDPEVAPATHVEAPATNEISVAEFSSAIIEAVIQSIAAIEALEKVVTTGDVANFRVRVKYLPLSPSSSIRRYNFIFMY